MSTASSGLREIFPIDSFRFLEECLQKLRMAVMDKAAEIAKDERPSSAQAYTVEREHIIRALKEVMGNSDTALETIGCA